MTKCIHYWLIEESGPSQPALRQGICKLCGEKKDFANVLSSLNPDNYNARWFQKATSIDPRNEVEQDAQDD